mgnify:CR=1 FL=1
MGKRVERKHIDMLDYHDKMNLHHYGKLDDNEIKELEEDIKSWELFRINGLIGLSNFDLDGIPTPLLQKKLKDWSDVDFNGDGDENYYINIFDIVQFDDEEDNKKLYRYKNSKLKTIGEYYRTLEHQSMMYRIHYMMDKKSNTEVE